MCKRCVVNDEIVVAIYNSTPSYLAHHMLTACDFADVIRTSFRSINSYIYHSIYGKVDIAERFTLIYLTFFSQLRQLEITVTAWFLSLVLVTINLCSFEKLIEMSNSIFLRKCMLFYFWNVEHCEEYHWYSTSFSPFKFYSFQTVMMIERREKPCNYEIWAKSWSESIEKNLLEGLNGF